MVYSVTHEARLLDACFRTERVERPRASNDVSKSLEWLSQLFRHAKARIAKRAPTPKQSAEEARLNTLIHKARWGL